MALTLAIGFWSTTPSSSSRTRASHGARGESARATLNGAKEISFTILSMTISLAAVFIPLVFMPGLVGRIFREFAYHRHLHLRLGPRVAHAPPR